MNSFKELWIYFLNFRISRMHIYYVIMSNKHKIIVTTNLLEHKLAYLTLYYLCTNTCTALTVFAKICELILIASFNLAQWFVVLIAI